MGREEDHADYTRNVFELAVSSVVPLGIALLIQSVPTKTTIHWVATGLLVGGGIGMLALRHYQMRVGRTSAAGQMVLGALLASIALVVLAYMGPFTAGTVVLPAMAFVYAFAKDQYKGNVMMALLCVGYALITVLAVTGVLPPTDAPIGLRHNRVTAIIGLALVVETTLLLCFVVARKSRKLLTEAQFEVQDAHAELDVARGDLDRAILAPFVGPLTGKRVGPYNVGEVVGRGGMGEVYRAWTGSGEAPVALKVLSELMAGTPEHVERFFREAEICSELDSAHIVKVLDSGYADDSRPYLAMELLRGRDLGNYLSAHAQLPALSTAELVTHVAEALTSAHAAGVVHRDLKPANIFLRSERDGAQRWVVLDFGASKLVTGSSTLTGGSLIGTPNYMSPEQASGKDVDKRSDVFALGAIAYRALTGKLAFQAEEPLAVLLKVMNEQPATPTELCADMDPDVELVLAIALAKTPEQRFATARDMAEALNAAVYGELDDRLRLDALSILRDAPWVAQCGR